MILEKIREAFPKTTRTEEQDLLIGSTCLALTDQERNTIENLNFKDTNLVLTKIKGMNSLYKAGESFANAQWQRKVSGFTTGGVSSRVSAWYLAALSPLWTAASGITGRYLGSIAGKKVEGNIGHERAIKKVTDTPEFIRWKDEKYVTVALPALSRYVNPDQESKTQLTCPITLDWMIEPVRAEDGYVYEKAAIIEHLMHWTDKTVEILALRQMQGSDPLSPQDAQDFLNTRSPFRKSNITIERLKPLPGYYRETVQILTFKYNMEVLKQRAIVDQSKKKIQDLPEETAKVVKFYSMTQEKRNHIKADMRRDLLVHRVFRLDEEEDEALEFLKAAAKPPELINYRI